MRFANVVRSLASGVLVYVVAAACAASGRVDDGARAGLDGASSGSPVPNAMADDWYASGSRVKIRYYEASDGAKQFIGWHDAERDDDCSFTMHANGTVRCLPGGATYAFFADAGCTIAIAFMAKGAAVPKYAVKSEASGVRIYASTKPYSGPVFGSTAGKCSDITSGTTAYSLFAVGDEVPASAFVSAAEKVAP